MDIKLQWLHLNTKLEPEPFLHFRFKLSFIVLIQNKGRQPKAIQPLFKHLSPLNYIFPFNHRTSALKPAPRREEANDCPTLGLSFDNTDTAPCKHQHQRLIGNRQYYRNRRAVYLDLFLAPLVLDLLIKSSSCLRIRNSSYLSPTSCSATDLYVLTGSNRSQLQDKHKGSIAHNVCPASDSGLP